MGRGERRVRGGWAGVRGGLNRLELTSPSSADVHQLEAPTYLFIQMQLCRKESLKDWLAKNIRNRSQKVVSDYFQQVLPTSLSLCVRGVSCSSGETYPHNTLLYPTSLCRHMY